MPILPIMHPLAWHSTCGCEEVPARVCGSLAPAMGNLTADTSGLVSRAFVPGGWPARGHQVALAFVFFHPLKMRGHALSKSPAPAVVVYPALADILSRLLPRRLRRLTQPVRALQTGFQPPACPPWPVSERTEPLHNPMLNRYCASLNLSLFVEDQNNPSIGQTPPFWLCVQ
jgi:hypothetical protein